MTPTVGATQTTAVQVQPRLRRKLLTALQAYAAVVEQIKALEEEAASLKADVETVRVESGATQLECEGYKVSYVQPVRTALNKELLLRAGVTMAQLEAGTETKPAKAYTKIALPGTKERE